MPVTLVLLLLAFRQSLVAGAIARWELEYSPSRWRWARLRLLAHLSAAVDPGCRIWRRCSAWAWASDYALLMVSLSRALAEDYAPGQAADMLPASGRTLIISATTVAIGFERC